MPGERALARRRYRTTAAVALALAVIVAGACTGTATSTPTSTSGGAGQRAQATGTSSTGTGAADAPLACEALPAGYDPTRGVTLPVTATVLPDGWAVLAAEAASGTYSVGPSGARTPLDPSSVPQPLITLFAVAERTAFVSDLDQAESLHPTDWRSPGGLAVTVWTPDGASLPGPLAIARWQAPNGTWVEATALHQVTVEQLLSVVDGVVGPRYCEVVATAPDVDLPVVLFDEPGSTKGIPLGTLIAAVPGGVAPSVDVAVSARTLPEWWRPPAGSTPPVDFAVQVLFFVSLRACATVGIDFADLVTTSAEGTDRPTYEPAFSLRPVPRPPCPPSAGRDPEVRSYAIAVDRARIGERFELALHEADPRFVASSFVQVDLAATDVEAQLLERRSTMS